MEKPNEREREEGRAERRREPRTPHRAVLVMPYGEDLQLRFVSPRLNDYSRHGVGFTLSEPLEPGRYFLLQLTHADRVLLVLYVVRHCRAEGERYQIGAEYAGGITGPDESLELDEVYKALGGT